MYNLPFAYTIKGNALGRRIKKGFFHRNNRFCVTCIREKLVYVDFYGQMSKVLLYERSTKKIVENSADRTELFIVSQ